VSAQAPPGFRAEPRLCRHDHSTSILTPSRLQRCALRLPPGKARGLFPPRTAWHPSMPPSRR